MHMDEEIITKNDPLTQQAQTQLTEVDKLKQENDVLKHELQQFRSYLEIANGTITSISADGVVSQISSNWTDILGYIPSGETKPFSFRDSVHPDDLELCEGYLREAFTSGKKLFGIEYRIRHKDGSWRWINANTAPVYGKDGKLVSAVSIAWDVTVQKETEIKLRSLYHRYRLLFETMREGVIIVDNDDVIQFINRSCCDIFGYTPLDLIGKVGNECLIYEADKQLIIDKNASRTQGASDEYEARGVRSNGDTVWLNISGAPLCDDDGEIIGSVGIMTDITESKNLKEELLASQKMEAVGKLAGGIAHDFNNLLNIVLGYGEELMDNLPPDSPLREGAAEILKAGERASVLTRQLLIFSRKNVVALRFVNINELINDLSSMLGRMIGESIDIKTTLAETPYTVKADPGQLELVIVNLAINSREAMPHGGTLRIETANITVDKNYLRSRPDIKPGQYMQLSVCDTGCGMDTALLGKIYEPYFTTKETVGGAGLGLSTIYGIVQQSEGYILVNSEVGKGTCFVILLPGSNEAVGKTAPQSHELFLLGKGEHILIVEDEKALLTYLEKLIKNLGYTVSASSDSMEALKLIRQGLKPDLIITDVVMPKMNGKMLADKVRELIPQQKLLFMSGFTDDPLVKHGVFEQGMPFIQKPFNSKVIAVQIRELLGVKTQEQESIDIFMLDDEDGIRKLFERACIKRGHGFTGTATLAEALTALAQKSYSVLLIDMRLERMDGIYALEQIREAGIHTPAIVFTGAIEAKHNDKLKSLGVIKTVEKTFDNVPLLKYIENYLTGL